MEKLTSIKFSILRLIKIGSGLNLLVSCLMTSFTRSVWVICFLSFIMRTTHAYETEDGSSLTVHEEKWSQILTSIWCFRPSSMRCRVSFLCSVVSTLEETVAILIFCIEQVKSALKEKESLSLISRPGGCFFSILNLAQARDCK